MESAHAPSASQTTNKGVLLQILGIWFGLSVTIGATMGSGILRTPAEIAAALGNSPWLFAGLWVVGGLYALLCCPSFAELGTMMPNAGGLYVFARRALGDYWGFVVGCADWLATCGNVTISTILIGELLEVVFPALKGRTLPLLFATVVLVPILQRQGIVWGSRMQKITSLVRILTVVGLGIAAYALKGIGPPADLSESSGPSGLPLLAAVILALRAVVFAYDGYYASVYFTEDLRDPERDIRLTLFRSTMAIMVIYVLFNLALNRVLSLPKIASEKFAWRALTGDLFGEPALTISGVLIIISALASINALYLIAPRILFAISRDAFISRRALDVNEGTPTVALYISMIVVAAFLLIGKFERVLAVLTFFTVSNYAVSFLSLFVLRRREPNARRPYRAWGYPWSTALGLLIASALLLALVITDTRNSVYALLTLLASYPAFHLGKRSVRRASRGGPHLPN